MINPKLRAIQAKFKSQETVCHKVLSTLSLFANKSRFRILCALCEGDFCVSELVGVVGQGKTSNISQQLKMLSLAGLIGSSRDHKKIIYRLKDVRVRAIVRFLEQNYVKQGR
ncbi:MAG: metalloregulator ArsR/SmtB family transcription factor [Chitinivibrionales bacterium]|nr:metalloregulator ArsR/SmtB family transcription factor [Chitinivibrionales bacterium]